MDRRDLEQARERVEKQLRWAVVHDADQELLDLLRMESNRLFGVIEHYPPARPGAIGLPPHEELPF
jgi:hypothetical protein